MGRALPKTHVVLAVTAFQIVQEFVLAQDLYLLAGKERMSWTIIERLLSTRMFLGDTLRERLDKSGDFQRPERSVMLQMQSCRQNSAVRRFVWLFHAFSAMPCSIPLDKVYALLGLVDADFTRERLGSIIDYRLTTWGLLRKLIQAEVVGHLSLLPFTYAYAENVIADTVDDYDMGARISWALKIITQLPAHFDCICLDTKPVSTLTHDYICLHALNICEAHRVPLSTRRNMSLYTYTPSKASNTPYTMLYVSSFVDKETKTTWGTSFLIRSCTCETHCTGDEVLDFAFDCRRAIYRVPAVLANATPPPLRHNGSASHATMQLDTLPKALQTYQDQIKVVNTDLKGSPCHIVSTDLKTLVHLAQTAKALEEAFVLELLDKPSDSL